MSSVSTVNWLRLLFLGLVWGLSFLSVSVALQSFGPLTVAGLRIALAAFVLLGVLQLRGLSLPRLSNPNGSLIWISALIIALASNALPFTLLSWGQQSVASGFAGVCMAVVPLIILPLAHFLVPGETMTLRRSFGFCIGTLGVAVLIGPGAFATTGAESEMLARFACVAAACCYAIGSITTRRCPDVDFIALSAAVMLLATMIQLPIAFWVEGFPQSASWESIAAVIYLGLLPTALAQLLIVKVVREAGPTFLSLVNYQVPVWSVIFGAVLLNESLPPSLFWALLLILSGLVLSQAGALKRLFIGPKS